MSPLSLIKQYGTSYYRATLRFPYEIRQAVYRLYEFVRLPDLVVDEPHVNIDTSRRILQNQRSKREKAYMSNNTTDTDRGQHVVLFRQYDIPFEYAKTFRDAMIMDTIKTRYHSYQELQDYMV